MMTTDPSMTDDADDAEDRDYYYRRAEAELALAQAATHPAVVTSHYVLAQTYIDRVYGDGTAEPDATDATPGRKGG